MINYDSDHFAPPSPAAVVILQSSAGRAVKNVILQLDTGADVTLVPRWAINLLDIPANEFHERNAMGFDGIVSKAQAVDIAVIFFEMRFKGRCIVVDTDIGVLGRDILNFLTITLNGPALHWLIQSPA